MNIPMAGRTSARTMKCFAISDLHLSFRADKPMDRFGSHWHRHWERVESAWRERISEQDLVLLPGDHSWAMHLEEADLDLGFIQSLPGHKVLTRGNHDYWWQSLGKIRSAFPGLRFIQNDALTLGDYTIGGTRGWLLPPRNGFEDPGEEKIYRRELERLRLSLNQLSKKATHRIAMIHYPPLFGNLRDSDFARILSEARIHLCVYGHIHRNHSQKPFQGVHEGVEYRLVSCDMIDFQPILCDLHAATHPEPA